MAENWTPGPLYAIRYPTGFCVHSEPEGNEESMVAEVYSCGPGVAKDNAHLFAVSDAMYAALAPLAELVFPAGVSDDYEVLLDSRGGWPDYMAITVAHIREARRVRAMARGEAQ